MPFFDIGLPSNMYVSMYVMWVPTPYVVREHIYISCEANKKSLLAFRSSCNQCAMTHTYTRYAHNKPSVKLSPRRYYDTPPFMVFVVHRCMYSSTRRYMLYTCWQAGMPRRLPAGTGSAYVRPVLYRASHYTLPTLKKQSPPDENKRWCTYIIHPFSVFLYLVFFFTFFCC